MNETKVSRFVELFENLPDQRQEWKVKHKLVDILFIAVVCTIADCDDWEEMEWIAKEKETWLRKYIELPNGIPSHDTIERVFAWIDPDIFKHVFQNWLAIAMGVAVPGVVAIDGKTMRGTKDILKAGAHVVNAWFSENGLVLGQVFTKEKSNEITAIPELLDILDIAGQIVTIDAAGTQRNIAEKIISKKGDYVLAVKGNQGNLMEEIQLFFKNEAFSGERSDFNIATVCYREKGHGRIEKRTYYVTDEIDWMQEKDKWTGLKSIGAVKREATDIATGTVTEEYRYYISSLESEVSRFAYAVRQHWGVESMHWSLDMTFNEDGRRSRKDNSAKNLAALLRFAYDIIKKAGKPDKIPMKRLRKKALMYDTYMEQLISSVF
ncbi:MAG: ISAs1 family transposase [Clostridiales Family XIII bacterium]|jgi:predicted transposase YbfD/YdcC|nr:ISAs1 family transposase [Clostridiales Family XIII bacterium]